MKHFVKYLFILYFILGAVSQSDAQQNKIDSLLSVLKTTKQDTNKVNTLLLLGWEFIGTYEGDGEAMKYNSQALDLSLKLKYKKGIYLSRYVTRYYNKRKSENVYSQEGSYKLAISIPAFDDKLFNLDKDKAVIKDIRTGIYAFINDSDQNKPIYNAPYVKNGKVQPPTYIIGHNFTPVLARLSSGTNGVSVFYLNYNKSYLIKLTHPSYYTWQIMLFTQMPDGSNPKTYPKEYAINAKLHSFKSGNIDSELEKIKREAVYSRSEYRFTITEKKFIAPLEDTMQTAKNISAPFSNNNKISKSKQGLEYNKNSESHNVVSISSGISAELSPDNDTINRIDLEDMKEGHWIHFGREAQDTQYLPDSKYFEGSYEADKRTGDWIKYFPNSDTAAVMNFDKNLALGDFKFFHPNGKLNEQGVWNFKLNKLTGKYREYFDDETLHKEYTYTKDGTRNGLQFVYYNNGNAAIIAAMSKDTLHGYVNYYAEDGQIYLQQRYKMGVLIDEKYFGDKNHYSIKLKLAFKELMANNDSIIGQKLKKTMSELSKIDSNYRFLLEQRNADLKNANLLLSDRERKLLLAERKLSLSEIENENSSLKIARQKIILIASFSILILVISLLIFVIRSNNEKKKANILLAEQKAIIEIKNNEITDSINYAKRIQQSILPPISEISAALPHSFVLFKPKDIVSGDFYWFEESNNKTLIAACDCTGHGVPGAIMSMLGADKLNESLVHSSDVSSILTLVNKGVKKALRQSSKEDSTRDGMDLALCAFDKGMNFLEYSGANRPLWVIRNNRNEIEEVKATKVAIGGFTDEDQVFEKHKIELNKNDAIYIFTDGFADQFSQDDKKLMTRKFKEILLSIQDKSMEEQKNYLDTFIEDWKGGMEQTDDILVIGIRI